MNIISNNNIAAVRRIFLKYRFYHAISGCFSCLRGRAKILGLAFMSLDNEMLTWLFYLICHYPMSNYKSVKLNCCFPHISYKLPNHCAFVHAISYPAYLSNLYFNYSYIAKLQFFLLSLKHTTGNIVLFSELGQLRGHWTLWNLSVWFF